MEDLDREAHSYGGIPTKRTAIQYGPGGFVYIFLIYGMCDCMNIVANKEGKPKVVLLRALELLESIPFMRRHRTKI